MNGGECTDGSCPCFVGVSLASVLFGAGSSGSAACWVRFGRGGDGSPVVFIPLYLVAAVFYYSRSVWVAVVAVVGRATGVVVDSVVFGLGAAENHRAVLVDQNVAWGTHVVDTVEAVAPESILVLVGRHCACPSCRWIGIVH